MTKKKSVAINIRQIHIVDYKGIDDLKLDFPRQQMSADPDILVIGSRNGLGKTSVLECCALLLIGLSSTKKEFKFELSQFGHVAIDMSDIIIRAGASTAQINGVLTIGGKKIVIEITIDKKGTVKIKKKPKQLDLIQGILNPEYERVVENFEVTVGGMSPNPMLSDNFLYFHSYRKVQEGNPELGMMVGRKDVHHRLRRGPPGYRMPMSTFKLQILHALMSKADLFDEFGDEQSSEVISTLNNLVFSFAKGTIKKLRPSPDNTVDFRIHRETDGLSFSFDGLSSGQKEIIATLFLIWHWTRDKPFVVFIDEPELHLNSEWHRVFVKEVVDLAPNNQYIMATHSEDVFDSVEEGNRIILDDFTGD